MYKTYIYLEVRVLLSAVPGVFLTESESSGKHDILTAKAEFLKRNNGGAKVLSVAVQPSVLHKAVSFVRAVGGTVEEKVFLEHLTGKVQEPPDDRNFTGFSVKVGHGGSLDIMFHQKPKKITFEEVRIEENAGHLVRSSGKNGGKAHMDWTFAGCPSMRIRTSAVFELGEEAELFLNELYTTLSYLKLVTGDLDEGSIRCNAYVCISDESGLGEGDLEGLVKLRNLNSFNFVRDAVNAELSRQEEILSAGGKITSESRLWIAESKMSQTWQNRESFVNQFKMVEPLVQVMLIHQAGSGTSVPIELPSARRSRFMKQYGLSRLRARFLCSKKDIADYFEEAVQAGAEPLLTSHWMAGELMKLLNQKKSGINAGQLNAQRFASIMKMLGEGKIHSGRKNSFRNSKKSNAGNLFYRGGARGNCKKQEPYAAFRRRRDTAFCKRSLGRRPKKCRCAKERRHGASGQNYGACNEKDRRPCCSRKGKKHYKVLPKNKRSLYSYDGRFNFCQKRFFRNDCAGGRKGNP